MQVKIRKYMHVEEIRGVYVCGGEKKEDKKKERNVYLDETQ